VAEPRPLTRRHDLVTEVEERNVLHHCGGLLERSYDREHVFCGQCGAKWKLSTFTAFSDVQLAERFRQRPSRPSPAPPATLWWVTDGPVRFLTLVTPCSAPFASQAPERFRC
jgi:hypothetical protein